MVFVGWVKERSDAPIREYMVFVGWVKGRSDAPIREYMVFVGWVKERSDAPIREYQSLLLKQLSQPGLKAHHRLPSQMLPGGTDVGT